MSLGVRTKVVPYLIELSSGLAKRTKDNIGFSTEKNRKYGTMVPMKYSVQLEVRPYPTFEGKILAYKKNKPGLITIRHIKNFNEECFIGYV